MHAIAASEQLLLVRMDGAEERLIVQHGPAIDASPAVAGVPAIPGRDWLVAASTEERRSAARTTVCGSIRS
jgi:hypothetical protein